MVLIHDDAHHRDEQHPGDGVASPAFLHERKGELGEGGGRSAETASTLSQIYGDEIVEKGECIGAAGE